MLTTLGGSLRHTERNATHSHSSIGPTAPGYLVFERGTTILAQRFNARTLSLEGEAVPIAGDTAPQSSILRSSIDVSQTGQLVYRGSGRADETEMIIIDRSGKQLSTLGPPGNFTDIHISHDGRKAAVIDGAGSDSNIWLYDLQSSLRTRFTFAGPNFSPVWSPDSSQLAFASGRSGSANIYVKPTTGVVQEKRLQESPEDQRPTSWSPDGRYLAYESRGTSGLQIYILPLFGDRKPYPLLNSSFPNFQPQFSPDGHWMAYISPESGQLEIYVTSFPGAAGKWQISTQGGSKPRWRRDGREIFYTRVDGAIVAADVNPSPGAFSVGAVKQLSQRHVIEGGITSGLFDAFPDGQRFIMAAARPGAGHEPLTLITNWLADLPK